jgi:hypothetical protein
VPRRDARRRDACKGNVNENFLTDPGAAEPDGSHARVIMPKPQRLGDTMGPARRLREIRRDSLTAAAVFVNRRKKFNTRDFQPDFLPRMPRRPNQLRHPSSLVTRSSSHTRCLPQRDEATEAGGRDSLIGHSFAPGRLRSRWRSRSAGLL